MELLAAAFPFFGTMDEQMHVDLVHKLARGYWPRQHREPFDPESIAWFVGYGTFEYLTPPAAFPHGVYPPPLWATSRAEAQPRLRWLLDYWRVRENHEKATPPLYYVLAGGWLDLGRGLGVSDGALLYWLRVLGGLLLAVGVWLTWLLARQVAPERPEIRWGAPLLLALLPQDVFYFVNSDVLSPVVASAAILLLLVLDRAERPSPLQAIVAGAVVAAAMLTKLTNAPLLLLLALAAVRAWRRRERRALLAPALLATSAALPIALWMARNHRYFGDLTGNVDKVTSAGWTKVGWRAALAHPLFTPHGAWTFLADLLAALWRGEVLWHGRGMAASPWDGLFVLSSLLFLGAAGIGTLRAIVRRQERALSPRVWLWIDLLGSVALLALLSVSFDYHEAMNPSREHPYFTSGRLISGALPAFAVLYCDGVGRVLARVPQLRPLLVVAVIAVLAAASGVLHALPAVASPYNWFHLP